MMKRIYYWEHRTDESRHLRSSSAKEMADVAHAAGGEVGVIIDDGGPLKVIAVELGDTLESTAAAMEAAGN